MRLSGMAPSAAFLAPPLLWLPHLASAFYLPGVAPNSYTAGDPVPLYVNSLSPIASQDNAPLRAVVPYDYYHREFQFCQPQGGATALGESLGSILFGDRIMTSPFELKMRVNETCKPLCETAYDRTSLEFVRSKVELGYSMNWLVDGMPAGQEMEESGQRFYRPGFMLGGSDGEHPYMNNHYEIAVEYHEVNGDPAQLRVVGATVRPASVDYLGGTVDCQEMGKRRVLLDQGREKKVTFSYGVLWIKSDTAWVTRWDKYLHVFNPRIHWFYLVNTSVILVVLVLTVSTVLVRALRKDIARYNRLDEIGLADLGGTSVMDDGIQEDSGWKLVHGDVFRPPPHTLLLSVLVGNGAQMLAITAITMAFALLGFLSPSNRGSLGSIMIILYTFLSFVGGIVSARVYRAWQGENLRMNIVLTPLIVPLIVFAGVLFLNLFLWAKQSSGAVPFTTILVLVAIWFVVSIPLSFVGSWIGFRAPAPDFPTRTNQIPRQIPPAPKWLRPFPSMLIGGLLPFAAISVELFFIMTSLWFRRLYYMFGFLFLCYGIMVMMAATCTVLIIYFLLCAENYHWQWRSFMLAGMSGGYMFLYLIVNLIFKLRLTGFVGIVLYVGYSALLSFLFAVVTGAVGYCSAWWFVRQIYSSLKVD